jgi:hypothetical protein
LSLSLTLTDAKNYDVFVYDNSGTLTLELSDAWTDGTTRADALALQDGVYVKNGATTRRWLGTIRASGTDTTEDSVAKRFVWNYYNQTEKRLYKASTTSHTYSTATNRQWNNDTANKFELVVGIAENPTIAEIYLHHSNDTGAASCRGGLGLDRTNGQDSIPNFLDCQVTNVSIQSKTTYRGVLAAGYHYLAAIEIATSPGTSTWGNFYMQGSVKG